MSFICLSARRLHLCRPKVKMAKRLDDFSALSQNSFASRTCSNHSRERIPCFLELPALVALPCAVRGPVDCSHGFHLRISRLSTCGALASSSSSYSPRRRSCGAIRWRRDGGCRCRPAGWRRRPSGRSPEVFSANRIGPRKRGGAAYFANPQNTSRIMLMSFSVRVSPTR